MNNVVNFQVEKLKRENEQLRKQIEQVDNRMNLLTKYDMVVE